MALPQRARSSVTHVTLCANTCSPTKAALLLLSYFASPLMLTIALLEVACAFRGACVARAWPARLTLCHPAGVWLLTVQPLYDGPTAAEALTPALLETLVRRAATCFEMHHAPRTDVGHLRSCTVRRQQRPALRLLGWS